MDDYEDIDPADKSAKKKKRWVVQKLPIKGGNVLRSAMLTTDCKNVPDWVQIEGVTKS